MSRGLYGSVNSLGLDVGGGNATAVHTLADKLLYMLLADNDGAAVENDNELFLPGEGTAAVGLAAAMAEAAVENDRTEIGFDVFENAHNFLC